MNFQVEVGTIPGNISEFHGPAHLRAGDPALVIRHPERAMVYIALQHSSGG